MLGFLVLACALLVLSVVCNLWLVRSLMCATAGNLWAIKTLLRMSPAKAQKLIRDLETSQSIRVWHRRILRDYEDVYREVCPEDNTTREGSEDEAQH